MRAQRKKTKRVKSKTFMQKLLSPIIWGNIVAMIVVIVALAIGVKVALEDYTHHGESIAVPDLKEMNYAKAKIAITDLGLNIAISDSGYNKALPAGCILAQTPAAGQGVKAGHAIYVTINTSRTPTLPIPDVIDNSSAREARARLTAMGFKLLDDELVTGERDWVYGIVCQGRRVDTGDMIPIESPLQLLVGSGTYDAEEVEYIFDGEEDEFSNAY